MTVGARDAACSKNAGGRRTHREEEQRHLRAVASKTNAVARHDVLRGLAAARRAPWALLCEAQGAAAGQFRSTPGSSGNDN